MRVFDQGQAEDRVKSAQADTLMSIGAMVRRADDLDEVTGWLHADEAGHVRCAVTELRKMIELARSVEASLDVANRWRRARHAEQPKQAAEVAS